MNKLRTLIVLLVFSAGISADPHSVENLFNKDGIHNVRLSPNGKYFTAVIDQSGIARLVVFSLESMQPVNIITNSTNKNGFISGVRWLNSKLFVYSAGVKAKFQENGFRVTGQYIGSVTKSKNKRTSVGRIIDFIPEKPMQFLDSNWKNGYLRICKNKIKEKLMKVDFRCNIGTRGRHPRVLSDYEHRIRVSYSTEEDDSQHFYYRNDHDSDWQELAVYNRYEGKVKPLGFSLDNKKILTLVSDDSEKNGIYWLDPKTMNKEVVHLFDLENYPGNAVTIIKWVKDSNYLKPSIIGYQMAPDRLRTIYFDENSKEAKLQRSLESVFPNETVNIVNYSSDGDKALVVTQSEKNPGSLYLMTISSNNLRFLLDLKPHIKAKEMFQTKPVALTARDGLEMQGYVTLPFNDVSKNKNLPMIVKVHGGPFGIRDKWEFDPENQLLASKGYAVLQVNFRGSGGYGLDFEYKAYKKMGAEMQDDITDATLWAIEKGYADKKRICIHGFSYGGYAALMGAVKEPDLYQCAIPSAGVYDIELFNQRGDIQRSDWGEKFLKKAWGNDESFFFERSPINHLDKLKTPLLITHGKKDERADFSQFLALTKQLDKMKYPYESMVFEKEGHSLYARKNQQLFYDKLLKFLEKHIGEG